MFHVYEAHTNLSTWQEIQGVYDRGIDRHDDWDNLPLAIICKLTKMVGKHKDNTKMVEEGKHKE